MIRLSISVALAFAVATSAEATSPAPLHEPDALITQVRQGRPLGSWPRAKCWDPNQRVINGICVFDAPLSPPPSTSVLHGGTAFALSTMGHSRGGGRVKPKTSTVDEVSLVELVAFKRVCKRICK